MDKGLFLGISKVSNFASSLYFDDEKEPSENFPFGVGM